MCYETTTAVTTSTATEEKQLTLDLQMLILRGKSIKRKNLPLTGVYPSSNIESVKKQVNHLLGDSPDEVVVLIGGETPPENATLSEYNVTSGSKMQIYVGYPEAVPLVKCEELASEFDLPTLTMNGSDKIIQTGDEPVDADLLQSEWPSASTTCGEKLRQPPPPLLMEKRKMPHMDDLALQEEKEGIQSGELFEISVYCNIILGMHVHHRRCMVPATGDTKVFEILSRLQSWLASEPDELTLLSVDTNFESHASLKDYGIIGDVNLMATAWYRHATSRDLPLRVVSAPRKVEPAPRAK